MKIFTKIKRGLSQVFNKKESLEQEPVVHTECLSASQFALATGIKIEYFTDTQEDSLNSTIISSRSVQTNATCVSSTFPKLDMNIFIPPANYKERFESPREFLSGSAPIRRGRRASEIGLSRIPIRKSVDDPHTTLTRISTNETLTEKYEVEDVTVETKGRFLLTTEKSFHWQMKLPSKVFRTSRFKFVSAESEESPRDRKDSGIELASW
jgi:hypothetical protein